MDRKEAKRAKATLAAVRGGGSGIPADRGALTREAAQRRVLHQVQIIPRGVVLLPVGFACIFPLDSSKWNDHGLGGVLHYPTTTAARAATAPTTRSEDRGYFKRQLARVSVRAAMLVRLRTLDVVGRSPRPSR